jgi:hypothetical protein
MHHPSLTFPKVMNAILGIPQKWVNVADVIEWNQAHREQLGKLRGATLRVHKLCFHALSLMFQENHAVQMFFAKQKILVPFKVNQSRGIG